MNDEMQTTEEAWKERENQVRKKLFWSNMRFKSYTVAMAVGVVFLYIGGRIWDKTTARIAEPIDEFHFNDDGIQDYLVYSKNPNNPPIFPGEWAVVDGRDLSLHAQRHAENNMPFEIRSYRQHLLTRGIDQLSHTDLSFKLMYPGDIPSEILWERKQIEGIPIEQYVSFTYPDGNIQSISGDFDKNGKTDVLVITGMSYCGINDSKNMVAWDSRGRITEFEKSDRADEPIILYKIYYDVEK